MRKSIKIQVEKISNGYLFTESQDEVDVSKTYNEKKSNLFDLLKENENIGKLINDDQDILLFEIIRHDINVLPAAKTNVELLEEVVVREKYSPFKHEPIDEDKLRLSVTAKNCYSQDRLQKIDFIGLDKELALSNVRKAEICGIHYGTMFSAWTKVKKGTAVFQNTETRIYMTVLAKYYEMVLGVRSSKKDELEKIKVAIQEQIDQLDIIFKKNALCHSNNVEPIIFALKQLL